MSQKSMLLIAVIGLAFAGGCSRGPVDASIVTNIQSQMFSDSKLKDSSLQVTSNKGQVTLTGTVPTDGARYEAYKLAIQTPGVTTVDNQITVQTETAQTPPLKTTPLPEPAPKRERSHREHLRNSAPAPEAQEVAKNTPPPPAEQPPAPQPAPPAPSPQLPPPPPPPPQPKQVEIPASTTMTIRMIDGVNSKVNHTGEIFHASLEAPLVVGDQVVVPTGADVYVRLTEASSARHIKGKSELHLELVKLQFQGRSYPLVSSTYSLNGSSRGKNTAEKVGGGAVLGTLLGAIAGGGKGAAIGAGVGAAGGGVYQGVTKGKQVKIPSETKLDFQLEQPVTVTVHPHPSPAQ